MCIRLIRSLALRLLLDRSKNPRRKATGLDRWEWAACKYMCTFYAVCKHLDWLSRPEKSKLTPRSIRSEHRLFAFGGVSWINRTPRLHILHILHNTFTLHPLAAPAASPSPALAYLLLLFLLSSHSPAPPPPPPPRPQRPATARPRKSLTSSNTSLCPPTAVPGRGRGLDRPPSDLGGSSWSLSGSNSSSASSIAWDRDETRLCMCVCGGGGGIVFGQRAKKKKKGTQGRRRQRPCRSIRFGMETDEKTGNALAFPPGGPCVPHAVAGGLGHAVALS